MANEKKNAKTNAGELQAAIQSLIAKGKKEGMIRAADLNALLEKMQLSPEKIEEIYDRFEAMNIQIVTAELDIDLGDDLDLDLGDDLDLADLDDPVDLSRLLIVTFTRDAAKVMRGRLQRALEEAACEAEGDQATFLADQLDELSHADISTLHTFCQKFLKKNF